MITQLLISAGILVLGLVAGWALTVRANEKQRSKEYLRQIARERSLDAQQKQWRYAAEHRVADRRTLLRGAR